MKQYLLELLYFIVMSFMTKFRLILFAVNPTQVRDLKGTGKITAKRIVVDMDEEISMLEPNSEPLLLLLNKLGKDTVHNTDFDWQEDDYVPMFDTANGASAMGTPAGTITLNSSAVFRVNDLVVVPINSYQVSVVTAVDTGANTIDVASLDGQNIPAIADTNRVEIIGNRNEEGGGTRVILSTQPSLPVNKTQIFKTPFGVTNTLDVTKIYGGKELDKDRKKAGVKHSMEIQKSLMFGELSEVTGPDGHPIRTMDGINNFITTYRKDMAGAPLTQPEWENYCEMLFEHGSDTKFVFCAKKIISYISSFAIDKVRVVPKDKTYGIAVSQYISPHGTVNLINFRKILKGEAWGDMAFGLDLNNIKYTILNGRDTKLYTNIQENDEDRMVDQYLTECSVKVKIDESHAVLENVG